MEIVTDTRAIDRQIAERLGWRVRRVNPAAKRYIDFQEIGVPEIWVINVPRDINSALDRYQFQTETKAWARLFDEYSYASDVALMMEKVITERLQVRINPQMDGSFFVWIDWALEEWSGHANTIPAAFWLAWLAYTAAHKPHAAGE